MANVAHSTLTGADLHEPKGVETAGAGTAYLADGVGSGTWSSPLANLNNSNLVVLSTRITDISTAASVFTVSPLAGDIVDIYVVLHGTIATANSIVTAEINGIPMSSLSITCTAAGSVAGSVFTGSPTGANAITAGGAIEIITDGASSNTVAADVIVVVDVS